MRVDRCSGVFVRKLRKYRYKLSNWLRKAEKLSLTKTLRAEQQKNPVLTKSICGPFFEYGTYIYKVLGSPEPPAPRTGLYHTMSTTSDVYQHVYIDQVPDHRPAGYPLRVAAHYPAKSTSRVIVVLLSPTSSANAKDTPFSKQRAGSTSTTAKG